MRVASVTKLEPSRRRTPVAQPARNVPRVGDVVCTEVVRVPGWFTVAQAQRVAELKRVSHVLVEDRGRVSGSASTVVLAHAPAGDTVARWMNRSEAHVGPEAPLHQAEQLLRAEGASCLPVVTGGLLVGTVTIHDLVPESDIGGTSRAA